MKCACGRPLHYNDKNIQATIELQVAQHGPEVRVTVGDQSYMVQRHYIALHGLKAAEIESLAQQGIVRKVDDDVIDR